MKADLARREPEVQKFGEAAHLQKLRQVASGRHFVLHDGPPYANGAIHLGRHQKSSQGRRGQVAHARRLRRAVCARLGLPRPADRASDREGTRQEGKGLGPREFRRPVASTLFAVSKHSASTSSGSA